MISPETNENVASAADIKVNPVRDLAQERREIIGTIPPALEAVPAESSTVIEHIATREEGSLGVKITKNPADISHGSRTWVHPRNESLAIDGFVTNEDGELSDRFPMYRVSRIVPGTDSGFQSPHYEISVADPQRPESYKPVALVMQSILGTAEQPTYSASPRARKYGNVFEDSMSQLTPDSLVELEQTGLYLDPEAQAQFNEVQTILSLVAAQGQSNLDQPALPIDFLGAA